MRDEDLDWEIYRLLVDGKARTIADLMAAGHNLPQVEESVGRLERYHLVMRKGDTVEALSVQESILLCQAKNDETCPFIVEDGIIKARSEQERKT